MATIVMVSEGGSFLVSSLITLLEENHNTVYQVENKPNELGKYKNLADLVILYAEGLNIEGVIYLRDMVIEKNIPVFLLGDEDQVADVEKVLSMQLIQKEFLRPVNVKEVAAAVKEFFIVDINALKKRILVVDDSGSMLRNVKGWLEHKYQVVLANSGTMAIKCLAMKTPDLILLDYEMPVCDGKQVLEMIRNETEFADIPVIFLTNKNDKESVMSVSSLRPEGYLLKSMEPEQIVAAIDHFFEKKKWEMV